MLSNLWSRLLDFMPNLLAAIAILILGWLLATIIASTTKKLLKKTQLDNRIAGWILGKKEGSKLPEVEKWLPATIYWFILLFVLVAVLNALKLEVVSAPLNNFLGAIFTYLPRIGGATLLLGVAWLVATVARFAVVQGLKRFNLDDQLALVSKDSATEEATPQDAGAKVSPEVSRADATAGTAEGKVAGAFLLNETLGNILYWLILLFFLPLILDALDLQAPLQPLQNLINQLLSVLPRIFGAVIIGAIGWFVARIVRGIITNLLIAAGANSLGSRLGMSQLAQNIGMVVYLLVLIPAVIAAFNALDIRAISDPAVAMLEQVLRAVPLLVGAGFILAVFYFVGQVLSNIVTQALQAMGFDNILTWLGLPPLQAIAPVESENESNEPVVKQRTPSEVVGLVAWVGVVLLGAIPATELLQFAALTDIVQGILLIAGRVLIGVLVFSIGLYLANLAHSLVHGLGGQSSQVVAQAARIAILIFVGAMALQQMGVATDIVVLAFSLILGAIAVAVALAFGLGGRDVAAEQLRQWLKTFEKKE
ncbi:mechanosensitive ion channel [Synechococcus sp. Nb3U1]|uniref:mechanosensitive ion channel n=1 Tax=Synechococcus sp. Nb3U1 TaxID=1914529 RepID=UPI002286713B|nr:mechanosensitive ion channel [Synechococcus sp. Nb3U1]